MPAGYSGTHLVKKLGIKEGFRIAILEAPPGYAKTLGRLPKGAAPGAIGEPLDFIQLFAKDSAALKREVPILKASLKPEGMLWLCWPKESSRVWTDLRDGVVREAGLSSGLVDVKVCAIDKTWSGLKFVRRTKDRRVSVIGA